MGVDEDIRKFEEWAESLGCPQKTLPPKKTLNRIFSSGQMLAFNEMMRRIRPQQEVKQIRDEIKVRKIEQLSGNPVMVKKVQSEQLYLHQTKNKLTDRLQNLKARVAQKKQEYTKLAVASKENNIKKLQLKEDIVNVRAKHAISKLKIHETKHEIDAEKKIGLNIDAITPVKFTLSSGIDDSASVALAAAIAELQKFYASFKHTENYDVNRAFRKQLWDKLRNTFAQIPNLVLWTNIGDQMKQKLSAMESLSMMDMEKVLYVDAGNNDPNQKNNLQIDIGKLYAKHMKICIKRHKIGQQLADFNDYVVYYEAFLKDMRLKFVMFNNQTIDDDFLADYLNIFSKWHYGKGEIEYLLKIIDENELNIQRRKKYNEEYLVENMELKNIYAEVENLYVRTRKDIFNLSHVRERIQHSEELMRYFLQCKRDQPQTVLGGDARLNSSVNSSSGSDDSTRSESSTLVLRRSELNGPRSMPANTLSNQLNELNAFFNTPIYKFKLRNPTQDHLNLCINPFVAPKVYIQLPKEMKNLVIDYMMTPAASIKNIRSQIDWFSQIAEVEQTFVPPDNLSEVDELKLSEQKREQDSTLTKLTDEMGAICSNIHRILENYQRYRQFIDDNPITKYIPQSETFNGKTYQTYEREFMMYYKMIQKPRVV